MAKKTIDEETMLVIMGEYPPAPHVGTHLQVCVVGLTTQSTDCQELPEKPRPGLVDDILQKAV